MQDSDKGKAVVRRLNKDDDESDTQTALQQRGFDVGKVARTLSDTMDAMLADKSKLTPEAVNASCNCAQQITNLIRVHLEAERLGHRMGKLK